MDSELEQGEKGREGGRERGREGEREGEREGGKGQRVDGRKGEKGGREGDKREPRKRKEKNTIHTNTCMYTLLWCQNLKRVVPHPPPKYRSNKKKIITVYSVLPILYCMLYFNINKNPKENSYHHPIDIYTLHKPSHLSLQTGSYPEEDGILCLRSGAA